MKALAVAIAALIIAAVSLVAFAPATLVDRRIAQATDGRVRIAEANGTVWQGRGQLTDARGVARIPIEWRIDPVALARGVVDATIASAQSATTLAGRVTIEDTRTTARDLRVALPAAAVIAWAGGEAATTGGEIAFRSDALVIGTESAQGAMDAQWREARGAWSGAVVDLGTVTLRLAPSASGLAGPLEARGGALTANGTVELAARRLGANVELIPSPDAPDAVRAALLQLGPPDARGAVRFALSRER